MSNDATPGDPLNRIPLFTVESYFALWAALIPATTVLVVPSIQGTTPAYLLALAAIPVCAFSRKGLTLLGIIAIGWMVFYAFSQFGLSLSGISGFAQLNLIEPNDRAVVFRKTSVTQTLYFVACVATFVFTRFYFRESWTRYVFIGAWLLALYGLYEWMFFAIFGRSGDFLGNREFHSGTTVHTGSWSQTVMVGPVQFLRLKSFTGEPSFFALAAVPYFALAVAYGRKVLAAVLLLTLVLSFSTSAYLGILVTVAAFSYQRRSIDRRVLASIVVGMIGFAILYFVFPETYAAMFTQKFAGQNESGAMRYFHMTYPFTYYSRLPITNQLFGVGFGTVYLAGTVRVLLDLGLVGLCVYLAFFLWPVIRLPKSPHNIGWTTALLSLLFLYTVSAAELFSPATWLVLGISYSRMAAHGQPTNDTDPTLEVRANLQCDTAFGVSSLSPGLLSS